MRRHRVWIEIVLVASAIACLVAVLLATVGAAAGRTEPGSEPQQPSTTNSPTINAPSPSVAPQTYEGMLTCSRCGAKHSAALDQAASVCVRVCVHGGANFALVNADSSYLLDGDVKILKKLAGQRARVVGSLNGKTIEVVSVTAD